MTLKEYIKNNFERIYYINLDSRKDRRERCIEIFKQYDIYDIVERIPGKVFTEEEIRDNLVKFTGNVNHINLDKYNYGLKNLGRWGCTTGHLRALQTAKDNNIENILIFEDDVEIYDGTQDTVQDYEEILENANKTLQGIKWDLHYLGYYPNPQRGLWSNPKLIGPNIFTGKFLQSTHAVAYNKRTYNKILDDLLPSFNSFKWRELEGTIDEYLGFVFQNYPDYITTALTPILVYQRADFSDIQQTSKDYTPAYLKNNILMLRDRVPDEFIRFPIRPNKKGTSFLKMNKKLEWEKITKEDYERYTSNTF